MPVISEQPNFYSTKSFSQTTVADCELGNKTTWDLVDELHERIRDLRDKAAAWLDLQEAIEAFGVNTAGELPDSIYRRHRALLDQHIIVIN